MLEKVSEAVPFDYTAMIDYLKQFPSVTCIAPGRSNYFVHLREKCSSPVRDLDGQQLRILLESFGIKVYSRVTRNPEKWNELFNTDCYVTEIPEGSLPIIFPYCGIFGGKNNSQWWELYDFAESGRPYLWWFCDVGNDPTFKIFTRIHPNIANATTIGLQTRSTYRINFNSDLITSSDIEPSIPKMVHASATLRSDLKKRMRYLTPEYTDAFGLGGREAFGFTFNGKVKSNELVDLYSHYFGTLFTTSSSDILGNVTPRLYETMCSNAVVFFDTVNDLDMSSWAFRKVTSKEDLIKKLKYVADHPDFRKKLVDEQHAYIRRLDDRLNSLIRK